MVANLRYVLLALTVIGKAEGDGELWHGHVSAVTVAPAYRRQGLAQTLMDLLEEITEKTYVIASIYYLRSIFVRQSLPDCASMNC